jgi:superfamily II DNA/RNA helicase
LTADCLASFNSTRSCRSEFFANAFRLALAYGLTVASMAEQLGNLALLNQVTVPDLWQQQAVAGLRAGQDVVVQAPTGSGKTLIFELWSNAGKNRGQAIYTVPTRALANDKLAEWRGRGWEVGIATGDLADNLGAPIIVATLETQKHRLIQGDGPALLVVDEYQMLADPDRGLNYELALALAPPRTQLLLLSGSVANPQDIVKWLHRLGRDAVLVRSDHRPVPLDEVSGNSLSYHVPAEIRGYWPRLIAKALADNLGPILIFAPRRQAAEALASELTRYLPTPNPLSLRLDQKQLVGEHLAKMLKNRIAYHHSGLSYGARAGVIEPLAKAGQLRVVVATMGLAAGINFSLRSVALAAESYRRDYVEHPLRPDEILQMFGRAGRRGIDEMGYVIVSANQIRLREAYPAHLSRSGMVDWGALLGLMSAAADQGHDPFLEAVKVQERLFSTKPIFLGVEESLKNPVTPCGLKTDAERARHVRKRVREMLNSRGEWEIMPNGTEKPLREICVMQRIPDPMMHRLHSREGDLEPDDFRPALRPVLSEPAALEKVGTGILTIVSQQNEIPIYGRAVTVAEVLNNDRILLVKWIRRLIHWNGRQALMELWQQRIVPLLQEKLAQIKTPVVRIETQGHKIVALVSLADLTMRVPVDSYGTPMWRPVEREVLPPDCARCVLVPVCRQLSTQTGVALLWRRLGLVDTAGVPTLRGRIVSFFSQGYGLAIAAGLEDPSYALDELIYDLANLDAGFRFCGEENRWAGRLPWPADKSTACNRSGVIWKMACRRSTARGPNR